METQEQLLTIQQLSLRLNIPKPTLRFWEKELDGIIVPLRTRGGQRRYSVQHILIIEEVTNLKKRGIIKRIGPVLMKLDFRAYCGSMTTTNL